VNCARNIGLLFWAARSTVTRENRPGDSQIVQKRISLLNLMILVLTTQWLLSLSGQSIVPGIPHTGGFIYMLSFVIVVLIITKFLSWL